jgi:2-succinyl-6-hydroxy-2,4-cyclohexadiene-1-carboxylate synthase
MRVLDFERVGAEGGPALICLHGFMGGTGDWHSFAENLPSCEVISVMLPGHDGHRPGDFSERLIATLDALGRPSGVLVGYSLGGRLGLRAALEFPERFPVFVGVSTTAGLEGDLERRARFVADQKLADRLRACDSEGFEEFLSEWWNLPVFDSPYRKTEAFEGFLSSRRRLDPNLLADCLELWSPGVLSSLWSDLAGYPGRALLVAGECDGKYSRLAERMAAALRSGGNEILAGCGHRILEENPEGLARCVAGFLEATNFGIGPIPRAE